MTILFRKPKSRFETPPNCLKIGVVVQWKYVPLGTWKSPFEAERKYNPLSPDPQKMRVRNMGSLQKP
jgi:hypothetical protein